METNVIKWLIQGVNETRRGRGSYQRHSSKVSSTKVGEVKEDGNIPLLKNKYKAIGV